MKKSLMTDTRPKIYFGKYLPLLHVQQVSSSISTSSPGSLILPPPLAVRWETLRMRLPWYPPCVGGCKNYPCSIALRTDWKINRDHHACLVSSNQDWFDYMYTRGRLMPPRVLASKPKPCGGNNGHHTQLPYFFKMNSSHGVWKTAS